jgi:hypothetical protein
MLSVATIATYSRRRRPYRDGRVSYKGGREPLVYKTGEMEQLLVLLLLDESKNALTGVWSQRHELDPRGLSPARSGFLPTRYPACRDGRNGRDQWREALAIACLLWWT